MDRDWEAGTDRIQAGTGHDDCIAERDQQLCFSGWGEQR